MLGDFGGTLKAEYLALISMRFLPPSLHHLVNRRFCQTWFQTFLAVGATLDAKCVPSHAQVAPHPDAVPYVTRGGRVEYVLDAIFDYAREQFNDESFEDIYSDNYEKIPSCANDWRFDHLVRQKLGLDPLQHWGPYYGIGIDEMDDNYDEDDHEDHD